jgi:Dockerin type I domain
VVGRPQPSISLHELRAVVAHVRALDREKSRRPSRAHIWAYAAFLVILLGSVRAETPRAYLPSSLNPIEESRMRTLQSLGVVSSFAIASVATAQSAVQWRVEDGGNGHWYHLYTLSLQWGVARIVAQSAGADLAGLETAPEWAWVRTQFTFVGGVFVGGAQNASATSTSAGWSWLSGEPFQFTGVFDDNPCNFSTPGVENGQQNFLHLSNTLTIFGDVESEPNAGCNSTMYSLFEWSADCNADGIIDYGQIRSGQLTDLNANNIPDCCEGSGICLPCRADIDQSGAINGVDLAAVLNNWGTSGGKQPRSDVNADGIVDGSDLAEVLNGWGSCS